MNDYEAGINVRREALGDEHVDRAIANTTDLTDSTGARAARSPEPS